MGQEKIIVCSWNVNSIRARILIFKEWIKEKKPDIILLQEIKARNEAFPYQDLAEFNYNIIVNGQKSYNGVAIMSKYPISDVQTSFGKTEEEIPQARYIEGWINFKNKGLRVASVYAPNGNPVGTEKYKYKLDWLKVFTKYAQKKIEEEELFLFGGDFNICPYKIDTANENMVEDDAIYQEEVKYIYKKILNYGYFDAFRCLNESQPGFTYWDYGQAFPNNLGVRIDHFLLSSYAMDKCDKVYVDIEQRKKNKPSDHAPLIAEFSF